MKPCPVPGCEQSPLHVSAHQLLPTASLGGNCYYPILQISTLSTERLMNFSKVTQ